MPNEPEKTTIPTNKQTIHTSHQLPIDLANKVIVKSANDNSKMSIQPTFRTVQQSTQMRVLRMPGGGTGAQIIQTQLMPHNILKPSIPGRAAITVSKSPSFLPRVTTTINTIQGGKGTPQIRTPTPPSNVSAMPTFVRTTINPRTSSPNTTWVSGSPAMQMQMQSQIIRSTLTPNRTITANIFGPTVQQQNSTIGGSTPTSGTTGQPTYVATVVPNRAQGTTILYTSQQQQPFLQSQGPRMGLATSNTRQIRPIPRIQTSAIRVNASSLSIRQNVPGLAPAVLANQTRNASTTISNTIPARIFQVQSPQTQSGSQAINQPGQKILSNVMLPIIVNNRLTHSGKNPLQSGIIAHVSKLASGTVSSDGTIISNSLTNTMPSITNTMVASIQPNQSIQSQVSQGNNQQQGTIYTTQSGQQVSNITNQGGNQIITMSQQQQQQLINSQQANIHQGNIQTVVPLQLGSRNANIPIKTITVSTSNSGSMDSAVTVHRNLTSNAGNLQATTIMPIAKIVSQHQIVNSQQNISGGQVQTPVYIQTRIPTVSTAASSIQSQVISVSAASGSAQSFSSSGNPTVFYEQASLSSNSDNKSASSNANNETSYAVTSSANVRYSEKMIHSIIASSFQNQNNASHLQQQQQSSVNQQSIPIRFSPLIVESQSGTQGQQTPHQIITMGTGNVIQQQQQQQQQQQGAIADTTTHMIVPISNQVPTSPRGPNRNKNETTPVKASNVQKKQPKLKNYQIAESLAQMRVPQRQQLVPTVAQITQSVKQMEQKQLHSTASSPKTTFSDRGSPSHVEEWSDGSTTVSIPNSPSRSEDEDLDAMIMSNQFNKMNEDYGKFNKTPGKLGSGLKRDAGEHHHHQGTPRTKKIKHERAARDITDSLGDVNNENSCDNVNTRKKEIILKKRQVSLLQSMQNYKQVPNHFMRYSDVKERDDRRPSVMDLANQPKVSQRVHGWKTHLISAEIVEMVDAETNEMEKLNDVLKKLETNDSATEVDKVSELIKGSMQRSRLIIDSFNDSKTQLLKIFEHKDHAADIINRCASKRNFKKR